MIVALELSEMGFRMLPLGVCPELGQSEHPYPAHPTLFSAGTPSLNEIETLKIKVSISLAGIENPLY